MPVYVYICMYVCMYMYIFMYIYERIHVMTYYSFRSARNKTESAQEAF